MRYLKDLKIPALPFLAGCWCFALCGHGSLEFAGHATIVFSLLVLTRQVRLL